MEENKKYYRVTPIEGKITWQVEELWDGGVVRGPYWSQHAAIKAEETIAKENGFIDDLALQEVKGEEVMPENAFERDKDGNWRCLRACSIDVENKRVALTAGMEFQKGSRYQGIDVTEWLEKNYYDQQRK